MSKDVFNLDALFKEDTKYNIPLTVKEYAVCLKCNKKFRSDSKFNKICTLCKKTNSTYRTTRVYKFYKSDDLLIAEEGLMGSDHSS